MKNKLLIIGIRLREYPRNVVLLDTLQEIYDTTEVSLNGYTQFKFLNALLAYRHKVEAVVIIQPAQKFIFPLLIFKMLSGVTLIGDAFTSIYDTYINDRAYAGKWSLKAFYYFMLDKIFVRTCDTLMFDTEEHKDFFVKKYKVKARCVVVPVSVHMKMMDKVEARPLTTWGADYFNVFFWGYYIPLQGIEYIIRAAAILKEHPRIRFTLLGAGQTKKEMELLAKYLGVENNLAFIPPVAHKEMLSYTKGADLMLGIFGKSEKAGRVVANKIIESAALGVPLVTGRSPAVSRYFTDGESVLFAKMSDAEDLAKTILKAYNTKDLVHIGRSGQEVVRKHFSSENLHHILSSLLK